MFSVLGAEARRLMLPGPVVAAAHCKTHQKLEIFGNFVASRSAGPFVGRHFLLERHFAGEMISVGKARRCPFKCSLLWKFELNVPLDDVLVTIFVSHSFLCFNDLEANTFSMATRMLSKAKIRSCNAPLHLIKFLSFFNPQMWTDRWIRCKK